MLFEVPTRGNMMCMAEHLSWMSTEVHGQANLTNQCWPCSVLIVSLSDCQLSLSNDAMLSIHVLPKFKIWKLITSVQVDHSCRNSPCFNCVSYLCSNIMLLPVLMMIYAYVVFAEINIYLTLTLTSLDSFFYYQKLLIYYDIMFELCLKIQYTLNIIGKLFPYLM